jgi:hypothetical protein
MNTLMVFTGRFFQPPSMFLLGVPWISIWQSDIIKHEQTMFSYGNWV